MELGLTWAASHEALGSLDHGTTSHTVAPITLRAAQPTRQPKGSCPCRLSPPSARAAIAPCSSRFVDNQGGRLQRDGAMAAAAAAVATSRRLPLSLPLLV